MLLAPIEWIVVFVKTLQIDLLAYSSRWNIQYQYHDSMTQYQKFFCRGRLIFGPDAASLLLTVLLIAGPSLAFCCQTVLKIIHHANSKNNIHETDSILGLPVLVVTIIVLISDLVFLLLTSGRDPGIVPRNAQPPESDEVFDANTPSTEWVHGRTTQLKVPRTRDVIVNGYSVKVKFCETCLLYRPPRASHCSICNNCVQKFDHHCPWVGQCIGLRNYRFFFLFISTSTFLCLYVFTFSWLNILGPKKHGSIWKSMRKEILSLVLIVYTFIAIWFVGGLTIFHLYLLSTNQTTYENFRYRYDKKENPYSKGISRNFKELFFSKIPPSMNDFRSWVFEEPLEAGSESPNIMIDINSQKAKFDNDMGSKLANDGNTPFPHTLQSLDGSIADNVFEKGSQRSDDAIDPYSFPSIWKPHTQETEKCTGDYSEGHECVVADTNEEGSGFNSAVIPVDCDAHVLKK